MPKNLKHWRHGGPNYTFVWQETPPAADAVVIGERIAEVAAQDIGDRKMLYYSGADQVSLAIANGTGKSAACVSLSSAAYSQDVEVSGPGSVVSGFSGLTAGATYYLSQTNAGEIDATKPATGETIVVGTALNSTDLSFNPQYLRPGRKYVFQLLPSATALGTPDEPQTTSSTFSVKNQMMLDFGSLAAGGSTLSGTFSVLCRCSEGSSGEVRLFNVTDAQALATISVTETTDTVKSAALTNIPASGIKMVTVEMKRVSGLGADKLFIGTASLQLNEVV